MKRHGYKAGGIPTDGWVDPPGKKEIPTEGWSEPSAGPLTNVGTDDPEGVQKNLATSGIKSGLSIPGTFGDIMDLGETVGAGVKSIFDKRSTKQIKKDWEDEREARAKAMVERRRKHLGLQPLPEGTKGPGWGGRFDMGHIPGTQDIYEEYVKPSLGEYEPTTLPGHLGSGFVQGFGPGIIAPGGKVAAGERVLKTAPTLVERALAAGRTAKIPQGVIAGTAGAGGAGIGQVTDNPFWTAVGGLATGVGAATVGSGVSSMVGPRTGEARARAAGRQMIGDIRQAKEDPAAVYQRALKRYEDLPDWQTEYVDPVSGEKGKAVPTVAEAGESRGLTTSELAASMTDAGTAAELGARREARAGAAKEGAKSLIDPKATGEEVATSFKQQAAAMAADLDKALPERTPEAVGADIRDPLKEGRKEAKTVRSAWYDFLEEHFGDKTLFIPGLKKTAADLTKHKPGYEVPAAPDAFTSLVKNMPDEVKFGDLRSFQKNVNKALETARKGQDFELVGKLEALQRGIWDDLNGAVENRLKVEAEKAARAGVDPDASFGAAVQRQFDEWRAARSVGEDGGRNGASQPVGAAGVPGNVGAAVDAGSQPGVGAKPGASEGIPGNSAHMGPEGVAVLKAANDAQRYLGKTYREGTVGDLLKEGKFREAWNTIDADVPRAAFPGGNTGFTVTREVMKAANDSPAIVQAVKDAATLSLRDVLNKSGGQIDRKALDTWKNKYRRSLEAIDVVSPGFSKQFDNLANTQSQLASKFIGAASVEHATRIMGETLGGRDGQLKTRHLVEQAGTDPAVLRGLQKLAIDHIMNTAEQGAGGTGNAAIRAKNMFQQLGPALGELQFSPEHLATMQSLINDAVSQQQHTRRLMPPAPNSATGHRNALLNLQKRLTDPQSQPYMGLVNSGVLGGGAGMSMFAGLQGGLWHGLAVAGTTAASTIGRTFMHNMRASGIRGINDMYRAGLLDHELGQAMLRHGLENVGDTTWMARVSNALANSALWSGPSSQAGEEAGKRRQQRAAGGVVGVNPARAAQHLTSLVARARRGDQAKTKELLGAHDDMVARALAVANRSV